MSLHTICAVSRKDTLFVLGRVHLNTKPHIILSTKSASFQTWDILSVKAEEDFTYKLYPIESVHCWVDRMGVFFVSNQIVGDGTIDSFDPVASRTDETTYISKENLCKKPKFPNGGRWNSRSAIMQTSVKYKRWFPVYDLSSPPFELALVFSTRPQEAIPLIAPPTIQIATIYSTSTSPSIPITMPRTALSAENGAIYNMAYGNNQMFTIIKSGIPTPIEENMDTSIARVKYNQTLTYFPFQSPYNMTGFAGSAISIPWNVDCIDYDYVDKNQAAAAGGKFYYACKTPESVTSNTRSELKLYVFDTKTLQLKNYTLPASYSGFHLSLVFGQTSEVNPTQAFIANDGDQFVHVVNLPMPTVEGAKEEPVDDSFVRMNLMSVPEVYRLCDVKDAAEEKLSPGQLSGITLGILIFVIIVGVYVRHRLRRKREERERAAAGITVLEPPTRTTREVEGVSRTLEVREDDGEDLPRQKDVFLMVETHVDTSFHYALYKTSDIFSGNPMWDLLSVRPVQDFWRGERYNEDVTCWVDNDGVFSFSGLEYDSSVIHSFDSAATRANSQGYISEENGCKKPIFDNGGDWNVQFLTIPSSLTYKKLSPVFEPKVPTELALTFTTQPQEAIPLVSPPTIQLTTVGRKRDSYAVLPSTLPKTTLSSVNGAIYNMAYGDNQMFTILKIGVPTSVDPIVVDPYNQYPDNARNKYNQSLTYFPFESPYSMTGMPESAISVPWNVDCADYEFIDRNLVAAANGKFYYVCQLFSAEKPKTSQLFIYDTKTSQLKNHTLSWSFQESKLLLAYNQIARPSEPFGVILFPTSRKNYAEYVYISKLNETAPGVYQETVKITMPAVYDVERMCGVKHDRGVDLSGAEITGIVLGVLFGLFLLGLYIRKWRRRRAAAAAKRAATEDRTVVAGSGLPNYEQSVATASTDAHIELTVIPRASVERTDNLSDLPLYTPRN
ncbi:hypothetical protein BG004_004916 [Podila humilis]|nr:hypothetical protein BG004_004916 [Podila humilis]